MRKYRFIACFGNQAWIICDYTIFLLQAGILQKIPIFFFFYYLEGRKSSAVVWDQIYAQYPARKSLNLCVHMWGEKRVSSPQLKSLQTEKQEANTSISKRLGIDVGLWCVTAELMHNRAEWKIAKRREDLERNQEMEMCIYTVSQLCTLECVCESDFSHVSLTLRRAGWW